MVDLGNTAGNALPDGAPELVYRNTRDGQVYIQYLHREERRLLEPADLNADGGILFGPGTIGEISLIASGDDIQVEDDQGALEVDSWGTGGSGLAGYFNVVGSVVEIEIVDGGSGYHDTGLGQFIVDNTGSGGEGLDVYYGTLSGTEGEVRRLNIVNGGSGYEPESEFPVLDAAILGHSGDPCIGLAYSNVEGVIHAIDLVEGGTEYESTPNMVIFPTPDQGSGAEFQAFLAGSIADILFNPTNPNSGGSGYESNPTITPELDGQGFSYRMVRSGQPSSVTVTNPGGNYVVPPTVVPADDTVDAVFEAVLWDDMDPDDRPPSDQTGRVLVRDLNGDPVRVRGTSTRLWMGDVDGDGDQDMMWRPALGAPVDNRAMIWQMDGATCVRVLNLDPPGPGWKPWKLADMRGLIGGLSGHAYDFLWWHQASGQVLICEIVPENPGNIGQTWLINDEFTSPLWQPWVVAPDLPGENDRIIWRRRDANGLVVADYVERNPGLIGSRSWIANPNGSVRLTGPTQVPWAVGNINGDGDHSDILLYNKFDSGIEVWQMDDDTVLRQSRVGTGGRDLQAHGRIRGMETFGSDGRILFALSTGKLIELDVDLLLSQSAPSDEQQALLIDQIDQLAASDPADIAAEIAQLVALLEATPVLLPLLLDPGTAQELLDGLPADVLDAILLAADQQSRGPAIVNAAASTITAYRQSSQSGNIRNAIIPLIPLPDEDDLSGSEGGSGSGGSSGSGSNDSGSGGGIGGGGGSNGSGGGSGGSNGGGSGGGGAGGLPDDFDPNDPNTWPAGVDSFEELLEYLQNLEL
ncbi:MAG: hypothetical protein MK077_00510 [Phycisphaerales bacterium]|nr:hypothetical protein [Phycisphaerales bacterium]